MLKNKKGKIWIFLGLLLIAAAFFLSIYNVWGDYRARIRSEEVIGDLEEAIGKRKRAETGQPLYALYPEMGMPVLNVDGEDYVGILEIPGLGLTLPVMDQWSDSGLQMTPCRYSGSVYRCDMIIAAHNYTAHFGRLNQLSIGDEVIFTDGAGHVFRYEVESLETLDGSDVRAMEEGNWDLTLFTCTFSGESRLTLRCVLSGVPEP